MKKLKYTLRCIEGVDQECQACYCRERHWWSLLLAIRDQTTISVQIWRETIYHRRKKMTSYEKWDKGNMQPLIICGGNLPLTWEQVVHHLWRVVSAKETSDIPPSWSLILKNMQTQKWINFIRFLRRKVSIKICIRWRSLGNCKARWRWYISE
jgi:hypothetical protein